LSNIKPVPQDLQGISNRKPALQRYHRSYPPISTGKFRTR